MILNPTAKLPPPIDSVTLMHSIAGVQKEIHTKLILAHGHRFVRKKNKAEHQSKAILLEIEVARLRVVKQELLLELSKNQLNKLTNDLPRTVTRS